MNTNGKKNKMQGKKPSHRRAIIVSLLQELIRNERLQTTPNRAKILKSEFDRIITLAKKDTQSARRVVMGRLGHNDKAVTKLYSKLLPRLSDIQSGYTNSARTLPRKGDNAEQIIVLVRGAKVAERKSRLSRAIAKEDKGQSAASTQVPVESKRKGLLSRSGSKVSTKKHESAADTRRVST